jgi:hypothetical protein
MAKFYEKCQGIWSLDPAFPEKLRTVGLPGLTYSEVV